jgi:4-aminobutyrate aminotransferase-like enzyme
MEGKRDMNGPGTLRTVPGPKSKEMFDREQQYIAPGLQSVALFSEIAVDRAHGSTIIDVDGNAYLDFIAGVCVGSLGHSHPHYVKRITEQLNRTTFGSLTTEVRTRFLELVAATMPADLTKIQLFSGGAEAVEAAFRLAKSATGKWEFVGFWGGFHGKTKGTVGLLGGAFRNHQGPFPPGMHMSPYANCYRCPWKLSYPSCGLACADHLRQKIRNETQAEVAAIIIEPIQGTAGNVIPPDDFLHAVKDIAHENDALLIADEILTGFGRTGSMWVSEHVGLEPDVMTIGKGMGGGFPLSGIATTPTLAASKPFSDPSGSSSSYGGNPLAAAAGLASIETIQAERLVENSARVGRVMLEALKKLQEKYQFIGDVRGRGLLIGVEMVSDRTTKEPLDKKITRQLFHEALNRGLLTMSYSHVIRINPPLVLTEDEARQGVAILDECFAAIARDFNLD